MPFFLRYVVVYVVIGLLLLGLIGYAGYTAGMGTYTWVSIAVFAVWIFGYHPWMLWRDYRRVTRLIADIRAGKFGDKVQADRVRESVRHLVVEYGGVPDLIAGLLIPRILTDDLVQQLAARLRARPAAGS